jgi:hypothetical protein
MRHLLNPGEGQLLFGHVGAVGKMQVGEWYV